MRATGNDTNCPTSSHLPFQKKMRFVFFCLPFSRLKKCVVFGNGFFHRSFKYLSVNQREIPTSKIGGDPLQLARNLQDAFLDSLCLSKCSDLVCIVRMHSRGFREWRASCGLFIIKKGWCLDVFNIWLLRAP